MATTSRAVQFLHGFFNFIAVKSATFLLVGDELDLHVVFGRNVLFLSLATDKRLVIGQGTLY